MLRSVGAACTASAAEASNAMVRHMLEHGRSLASGKAPAVRRVQGWKGRVACIFCRAGTSEECRCLSTHGRRCQAKSFAWSNVGNPSNIFEKWVEKKGSVRKERHASCRGFGSCGGRWSGGAAFWPMHTSPCVLT
ncbi:hypothetical protein L1887_44351 [Cichorium endivia]|nr:hypothetical protein L1887_44351 [Cichorium endivia]